MKHVRATATFARPANTTAYAVGDIVANHTAAGSVVVPALRASIYPGRGGRVTRVGLSKTAVDVTNAQFRVHLFETAAPAVTSGDNAVLAIGGNTAGYLGSADVTMNAAFSDGAYGDVAVSLPFDLPENGRDLFAVIEARAAYAPANAETFRVTLGIERD